MREASPLLIQRRADQRTMSWCVLAALLAETASRERSSATRFGLARRCECLLEASAEEDADCASTEVGEFM